VITVLSPPHIVLTAPASFGEADMNDSEMLQHSVKALGMRQVVTMLADMSDDEAQALLRRGDRAGAHAASRVVSVLRRVLVELPMTAPVGSLG
jgi:hypothetical protein